MINRSKHRGKKKHRSNCVAQRQFVRFLLPRQDVTGRSFQKAVAALALHLMTNTAVTGATYDLDGGQQLVEG